MAGVSESALSVEAVSGVAFDALLQRRELQLQRFDPRDYLAQINPSQADLEAFYKVPANSARFQLPESAEIEYVQLNLDALLGDIKMGEEELRKYYSENESRYTVAEERRASHILIKAEKDSSADARAKARAKAEELLIQARKSPAGFAELARQHSQDEGSAANGGDLDFFARGAMVKPFEDAAFALKAGEISNVVESDFGYHVIQVTGVRGGERKTFESVRPQIEQEVRRQLAQKRYTELAEQFSNTVYEQSDSLKPAADLAKLKVQTASVQRQPAPGISGALASPKLLELVFSEESVRNKRNTEAVEVGANQLVAARVIKHMPARLPELADVQAQVRAQLIQKLAGEMAIKKGQERLEALKTSDSGDGLSASLVVSRAALGGLSPTVVKAILSADASKLPAYVGAKSDEGGYVVARISKLMPRDPAIIDAKRAAVQYAQAWTSAESQAYYEALKARHKAVIKVGVAASAVTQ
jgi:peptidyl-prolyl cis-trans isomerase D